MDMESQGRFGATAIPVRAHRVVNREVSWTRGAIPQEVRVTACGERRTEASHPHGWWTTEAGFLPLEPQFIHCGA